MSPPAWFRLMGASASPGRSGSYMLKIGKVLSSCPRLYMARCEAPPSEPLSGMVSGRASAMAGSAACDKYSVRRTLDMNIFPFCIQGVWQKDRTCLIRGSIPRAPAANGRIRQRLSSTVPGLFFSWVCVASGVVEGACPKPIFDAFLPAWMHTTVIDSRLPKVFAKGQRFL